MRELVFLICAVAFLISGACSKEPPPMDPPLGPAKPSERNTTVTPVQKTLQAGTPVSVPERRPVSASYIAPAVTTREPIEPTTSMKIDRDRAGDRREAVRPVAATEPAKATETQKVDDEDDVRDESVPVEKDSKQSAVSAASAALTEAPSSAESTPEGPAQADPKVVQQTASEEESDETPTIPPTTDDAAATTDDDFGSYENQFPLPRVSPYE